MAFSDPERADASARCRNPEGEADSARCPRRVAAHGAVGGLAGYLALHPLSMLIHSYFEDPADFSAWRALRMSFSSEHALMAAYFVAIGVAFGAMYGLYACRTARLYEKVRRLSVTDDLTSLYNRRCLMRWLAEETARAERYARRLSLMMIDVDHFKCYNDKYGHQSGDDLLRSVAARLAGSTRSTDLVARYGGEAFVVVMPETGREQALKQAERMCGEVANHSFPNGHTQPEGKVTISLGVAEFPTDAGDPDALIRAADTALYRAKAEGRNRALPVSQRLKIA
ncbi:MAG: GGDEF domain-containing protein [Planctomycetota bacterium]|jgi:diguanylate cyclase (GGDEF)-like protein